MSFNPGSRSRGLRRSVLDLLEDGPGLFDLSKKVGLRSLRLREVAETNVGVERSP